MEVLKHSNFGTEALKGMMSFGSTYPPPVAAVTDKDTPRMQRYMSTQPHTAWKFTWAS